MRRDYYSFYVIADISGDFAMIVVFWDLGHIKTLYNLDFLPQMESFVISDDLFVMALPYSFA